MNSSAIQTGMASACQMKQTADSTISPTVKKTDRNAAEAADANPYEVSFSEQARKQMTETGENDRDLAMIDIAIENVKRRIREVREQLAKLQQAEGEVAENQKAMLTEMLASLNARLIELMNKKLELMG